jgi:hypothetical protein
MIDAPSGADVGIGPIGTGPYGHVGWAYLIDRDYGPWFFGANEGALPGQPSKTWRTTGSWSNLVATFTQANNYHAASYYKYVRCQSLPVNNSNGAASVVATQQGKPYNVPKNDCLSNAVDVLRTYGGTGLPSALNEWRPNLYFNSQLDQASYGPILPLK